MTQKNIRIVAWVVIFLAMCASFVCVVGSFCVVLQLDLFDNQKDPRVAPIQQESKIWALWAGSFFLLSIIALLFALIKRKETRPVGFDAVMQKNQSRS